jgi:hypothetical protein
MSSTNEHTGNLSLFNILHNSVHKKSHTIIGVDGKVHSYCGLKISDILAQETGNRKNPILLDLIIIN